MMSNDQGEVALSKSGRVLLFLGFALATFMMVLDYSIANVAIPYISGDLGTSTEQGTYVITSFAIGNAIGLALSGWLSKQFQQVKLLLLSIFCFTFFSWLCGAATSLEFLVIARFLQGFTSGPLVPLSQSLLLTTTPAKGRQVAIAIWGSIVITAPIFGPILGGWISDNYKWPWIFYINLPVGAVCLFILYAILKHHKTPIDKKPTNWIGIVLLTVAVSSLQIVLDKGEQWDWLNSNIIRVLSCTAIICFTFLFIWEFFYKHPILELRLVKFKSFALSIICLGVAYCIYFGSLVIIPLWLQTSMGYTAEWAGLAVSPLGIAPAFLSIITAKLITRIGALPLLVLCFSIFAVSCFYTASFTTAVDVYEVGFSRFIFGCGMTFFITPLLTLSVMEVPAEKIPSATSMFHFIRSLVGAFGTAIFTTLWQRRTIFHHSTLGSTMTPYTPNSRYLLQGMEGQGLSNEQSLTVLNAMTDKQASLLSMNDCFYLMGWAFVGLILLSILGIFLTRKQESKSSGHSLAVD